MYLNIVQPAAVVQEFLRIVLKQQNRSTIAIFVVLMKQLILTLKNSEESIHHRDNEDGSDGFLVAYDMFLTGLKKQCRMASCNVNLLLGS